MFVRTLIEAKNPVWANVNQTLIDIEASFEEHVGTLYEGFMPTTIADASGEQYIQDLWDSVIAGKYGEIAPYSVPIPKPEDILIIISSVTLWERMTEEEAEQVETVMATQPFRTRQIFMTAQTFRSDHELWPLLERTAIDLFGVARAAELLKQP